jgi:hypothetical protein
VFPFATILSLESLVPIIGCSSKEACCMLMLRGIDERNPVVGVHSVVFCVRRA